MTAMQQQGAAAKAATIVLSTPSTLKKNEALAAIADVLTRGRADAALAASIFHFGEITVGDLKQELKRLNIDVRC